MKALWLTIITSLLSLFAVDAVAARGVVVKCLSSCDYFIVETDMGYAVLEWYGGSIPDEGDELAGNFESYGMKRIYNLSDDAETRVWVENYWLSSDGALELLYEKCE